MSEVSPEGKPLYQSQSILRHSSSLFIQVIFALDGQSLFLVVSHAESAPFDEPISHPEENEEGNEEADDDGLWSILEVHVDILKG